MNRFAFSAAAVPLVAGNPTFHGGTRPVALAATSSKAYPVGVNATPTIRRSDFGAKTSLPPIGDGTDLRIGAAFEKTR